MSTSHQLSLSELQSEFTRWRTHRQPRHIPQPLREQAVGLLREHKPGEVVKALGINHQMLNQWKGSVASKARASARSGAVFLPLPSAAAALLPAGTRSDLLSSLTITHHAVDGSARSLEGSLSLEQWHAALTLLRSDEGVR